MSCTRRFPLYTSSNSQTYAPSSCERHPTQGFIACKTFPIAWIFFLLLLLLGAILSLMIHQYLIAWVLVSSHRVVSAVILCGIIEERIARAGGGGFFCLHWHHAFCIWCCVCKGLDLWSLHLRRGHFAFVALHFVWIHDLEAPFAFGPQCHCDRGLFFIVRRYLLVQGICP